MQASETTRPPEKIRLGVSSCLLGEQVRFDGGHKLNRFLTDVLGAYVEFVPVCPEVECGLPVPRESMRLTGDPADPRLVTSRTGVDHTGRMKRWARGRVKHLEQEGLCGFVFKSRSPSSGMERVKVYDHNMVPHKSGVGLFARAFMDRFPLLPVEEEGRLNDIRLRENFIERLFVYQRWQQTLRRGRKRGPLVDFHTRHKLLILSHSPRHYRELGRLVGQARELPLRELYDRYLALLMPALKLLATPAKNTNVLQHLMGYFKKQLTGDEKQELLQLIERYRQGLVPLVVPLTLINHYVRKHGQPYLEQQVYLNPHPHELRLRNHA
jgi:uncharacterized protein YbgA (DUF1722 family)/uncharacterized protein YbbK (DUF523 family)